MWRKLPNALSVSRGPLGLAALLVYSSEDQQRFYAGIAIIAAALATDFLDGFLARRLGVANEAGYILDGLGDRAMYVSIILLFVADHAVSLPIAWLLILREILIYAQRLLQDDWFLANLQVRRWSLLHAAGIRIWFLSYFIADGLKIQQVADLYELPLFRAGQTLAVLSTISASYYSLYRAAMLHWKCSGGGVEEN